MSAPSISDFELANRLRISTGLLHQAVSRALLGQGVTPSEWALLRDLHAAGAVPQTRLAERLGMTRGAISKLVDRLVAKRLLVRGRGGGGDRRVQIIGLTGTGALLVPELAQAAAVAEGRFFASISVRERGMLEGALSKLAGRASEG